MEKPNGQTMMVDTYVNLAHGKAVKEWPMTNCSNSRFTEEEWKKLQDTCEYEKVKIPTHETLAEKAKELYAFEHRTWTDAEITARLQRTGTLNLRTNMTGIAKWKRELALARDAGDKSKVAELEGIIAKLEPPKAILRGNSGLKNSTPVSTPTRKPIIKHETDDERLHRETARIQKENEAAIAREANLRRMREKTAAMRATKAGIASGTATPKEEAEVKKDEEVEALTNQVKQLQAQAAEKKVFGQLNKELNDDDVIGALDFDIDIEI